MKNRILKSKSAIKSIEIIDLFSNSLVLKIIENLKEGIKTTEEWVNNEYRDNNVFLNYSHFLISEIEHFYWMKKALSEFDSKSSIKEEKYSKLNDEDLDKLFNDDSEIHAESQDQNMKGKKRKLNMVGKRKTLLSDSSEIYLMNWSEILKNIPTS